MRTSVVVLLLSVIPLVVFGTTVSDQLTDTLGMLTVTAKAAPFHLDVEIHIPFFFDYKDERIANAVNGLVLEKISTFVGRTMDDMIETMERSYEDLGFWPAAFISVDGKTYKVNDRVISIAFEYKYLPPGGNNGANEDSITVDLEKGTLLRLRDLPIDLEKVREEIIKTIRSSNKGFYKDAVETVKHYPFYEKNNFYLTEDGVVFYFQEYEIASGYMGVPELKIPYSKLGIDPKELRAKW